MRNSWIPIHHKYYHEPWEKGGSSNKPETHHHNAHVKTYYDWIEKENNLRCPELYEQYLNWKKYNDRKNQLETFK